ncbi:MAG: agmatine deiminase family protein [Alphaproteobacteria bacterium]
MTALKTKPQTSITTPPEWAAHKVMWVGFPSDPELWLEDLAPAQEEAAAMANLIAEGELVRVLACGDAAVASAKKLLGKNTEVIPAEFGDIWLRDTGPIWAANAEGPVALRFRVNGWGGKYDFPADRVIGDFVAKKSGTPIKSFDLVLEGGSLENDGEGTIMTTRECLLNPNRNPGLNQTQIEAILKEAFGAGKILWLEDGLLNDHTDGHIDNIARFVAPGKVLCQSPAGKDDPNTDVLNKIAADLEKMTDARGRKLTVIRAPSPGLVMGFEDEPLAASHMNFIIGNKTIAVPTYGTDSADAAVAVIQKIYPNHKVVGLPSYSILANGGGSFHCMTQQEPL